jgi:YHS domain-containing protein
MRVDRRRAIHERVAGETRYFCSEHCLHAFEVNRALVAPAAHDHPKRTIGVADTAAWRDRI